MQQEILTKYCAVGGIMLIITMFANLVNIVNQYDSQVETTSYIVSAFHG